MPFCKNCGRKLTDDAKFCDECGKRIGESIIECGLQRKEIFDGEIRKCPNCSAILKSFTTVCVCGYELRGIKVNDSVREFSRRLEKASNEQQRINLIRGFAIPNTKEDIVEFMTLAVANFDVDYYAAHLNEEDISDAWLAKIEQCYRKAKLSFGVNDIQNIEELYFSIKEKTNQVLLGKKKKMTFFLLVLVLGFLMWFLPITMLTVGDPLYSLSYFGFVLIFCGLIPLLRVTKKKRIESTSVKKREGFSSWSALAKVGWVILNIYTLGIPAIIYANRKK